MKIKLEVVDGLCLFSKGILVTNETLQDLKKASKAVYDLDHKAGVGFDMLVGILEKAHIEAFK